MVEEEAEADVWVSRSEWSGRPVPMNRNVSQAILIHTLPLPAKLRNGVAIRCVVSRDIRLDILIQWAELEVWQ